MTERKPRCGCYAQLTHHALSGSNGELDLNTAGCLYPEAVKENDRLRGRLGRAEALIDKLILESGWMGDCAVQEAEDFLRPKERET